ncbi:MAG: bifunctional folylpolyglutamate synthase/dihydrofolate synthase [Bacteroidales bacterium]|nr:bifunctional folylpolyglutamate synthase/dihydrofolate synthase [Bacteroidales bacterium]
MRTYRELVEDLFSRHPSVQGSGFSTGAYKPGLDGMRAFDAHLGLPWKAYPCVLVAGTNGKGSVSSMLCSAFAAKGLRTALYTSPHLSDFRERMKVLGPDGRLLMPSEDWVAAFLLSNSSAMEGLSFFEITTGMAFQWFREQGVEMAIIEVGLGGRLDSTNIISPVLSIITSIGLDHCALLGDTRAKIAAEKAGIFRSGVPALVSSRDAETLPVFERIASDLGVPLYFADGVDGGSLLQRLDLKGPCQKENLRTVLKALELLCPGESVPEEAIATTAARTGLRGRWETLQTSPETIADIAHNPPALKLNFRRLEQMGRPLFIVFGIMADKDLESVSALLPASARYYLAAPATLRSLAAGELEKRLALLRPDLDCRSFASVADAVKQAVADAARTKNALVYIGGSAFVVSEALQLFAR